MAKIIAQPPVSRWQESVIEENVTMEEVQQVDSSEDEALQVAETSTVKGKGKAEATATMKKAKSDSFLTQRTTPKTRLPARLAKSRAASRYTTDDSDYDPDTSTTGDSDYDPANAITSSQPDFDVSAAVQSLQVSSDLGAAHPGPPQLTTGPQPLPITRFFEFEDYSRYQAALRDPARSWCSIDIANAEVTGIAQREKASLQLLKKQISSRALSLSLLMTQLLLELGVIEGVGVKSGSVAGSRPRNASKRGGRRRK